MRIIKLYKATLNDFSWTILLCILSFQSEFKTSLIGIFVISFIGRFLFNYILFSRDAQPQEKKQ